MLLHGGRSRHLGEDPVSLWCKLPWPEEMLHVANCLSVFSRQVVRLMDVWFKSV